MSTKHLEHLRECWACRCRAHFRTFIDTARVLIEWRVLHIQIEVIRRQRQLRDQAATNTVVSQHQQDEDAIKALELKEKLSSLRAKVTEELCDFKADRLAYFARSTAELTEKTKAVDKVSLGLKWSIWAGSMPTRTLEVLFSVPVESLLEAVELGCLALHGLRSELDDLSPGIDVPENLVSDHISAMLSMTVRLAAFQKSDFREWIIQFGEFNSEWDRFEKWIKKHHPFQSKEARVNDVESVEVDFHQLIREALTDFFGESISESPNTQESPPLETQDGDSSANEISPIAATNAPKAAETITVEVHKRGAAIDAPDRTHQTVRGTAVLESELTRDERPCGQWLIILGYANQDHEPIPKTTFHNRIKGEGSNPLDAVLVRGQKYRLRKNQLPTSAGTEAARNAIIEAAPQSRRGKKKEP